MSCSRELSNVTIHPSVRCPSLHLSVHAPISKTVHLRATVYMVNIGNRMLKVEPPYQHDHLFRGRRRDSTAVGSGVNCKDAVTGAASETFAK